MTGLLLNGYKKAPEIIPGQSVFGVLEPRRQVVIASVQRSVGGGKRTGPKPSNVS